MLPLNHKDPSGACLLCKCRGAHRALCPGIVLDFLEVEICGSYLDPDSDEEVIYESVAPSAEGAIWETVRTHGRGVSGNPSSDPRSGAYLRVDLQNPNLASLARALGLDCLEERFRAVSRAYEEWGEEAESQKRNLKSQIIVVDGEIKAAHSKLDQLEREGQLLKELPAWLRAKTNSEEMEEERVARESQMTSLRIRISAQGKQREELRRELASLSNQRPQEGDVARFLRASRLPPDEGGK